MFTSGQLSNSIARSCHFVVGGEQAYVYFYSKPLLPVGYSVLLSTFTSVLAMALACGASCSDTESDFEGFCEEEIRNAELRLVW